ncbi:hypothetical protein EC968_008570 [Mortierella alpina]|nr:hypothetical protein EC968_008570 [Mortierella alpina]
MLNCNIPITKPTTTLLTNSSTQFRTNSGSNSNQCILTRVDPPCQQTLSIACKQVIIQPASAESTDTDRLPASTVTPVLGAAETPKPLNPNAGGGELQAGNAQPSEGGPTAGASPDTGASASTGPSSVPLAAVIGGAVGGVVLLLVLVALFVCMRRRKARRGRGRDRYVVQLKSEPDFNEPTEKSYQEGPSPLGSPSASHSSLPRPLSLPRSSLPPPPPPAAVVPSMAPTMAPTMADGGRERQSEGYHAYQHSQLPRQALQHQSRSQPPLPPAQHHQRANSPTGPGPVAMSPVEYTPRSTYIPSSPSWTEPRSGQPTPSVVQPDRPDSVHLDNNTYIDLIPVEDTPQISHASLPMPLSLKEGGAPSSLHRHEEEQLGEDDGDGKEHGHEQQGLLRSGAREATPQKALSKTAAALDQDDDDDDDDEEIKYL